ncbi:MAG: hypothetical protein ABI325_11845 [Ginsengibacter sp.]
MKNRISLALAIIGVVVLFTACTKANIETGKEKIVALHDCTPQSVDSYICFDSLLTDSRCPKDVECVWQGTALIKVTFSEMSNSHQFVMSLKGYPDLGYPSDTSINGHRIIFTDLTPHPVSNSPQPKEVKAFFNISE